MSQLNPKSYLGRAFERDACRGQPPTSLVVARVIRLIGLFKHLLRGHPIAPTTGADLMQVAVRGACAVSRPYSRQWINSGHSSLIPSIGTTDKLTTNGHLGPRANSNRRSSRESDLEVELLLKERRGIGRGEATSWCLLASMSLVSK
jgi:hypothetical protein